MSYFVTPVLVAMIICVQFIGVDSSMVQLQYLKSTPLLLRFSEKWNVATVV